MKAIAILLALPFLAAGCEQSQRESEARGEEPQATASASAQPPQPSAATATEDETPTSAPVDVPTEEDFEEEAFEEINAQNLEEELDKLEEEIGG